jgi:hypothetical protein
MLKYGPHTERGELSTERVGKLLARATEEEVDKVIAGLNEILGA